MRAFIAADIPYDIRKRLTEEAELALAFPEVKLVEKENMHLTIAFLGNLGEGRINEVKNVMDDLKFGFFDIEIKGLAYFGNPGAVYSAIGAGAEKMEELALSVRTGLNAMKVDFDDKKFVPHVTVARIKKKINETLLKKKTGSLGDRSFGMFRLDSFSLYRSVLTSKGSVYERLYERKV